MLQGRLLLVSPRTEVVSTLEPLLRTGGHLVLSVPGSEEAMQVLEEGNIPDVLITHTPGKDAGEADFVERFRRLNAAGQHLVIADEGVEVDLPRGTGTLSAPFDPQGVRAEIGAAVTSVQRELQSLRSGMLRETARLQGAIRTAQVEMISALARTMEARDRYMHGHCERVAELCGRVAEIMGRPPEEVELVANAARIHEIGKVALPLELLHREGELEPEELEMVRGHAAVGAGIVEGIPSLRATAPLILHQYTDYRDLPDSIAPETPEFLLAAILRVVDAHDAMISDRAFRTPLTRPQWEGVLRGGAGLQYHPRAVKALLYLLG